ncbi:MAG: extracellular solute-binding protein [Ignavibacteriales bacterium]|nr:extracellular solute-binding protein [Ignavibacteriales bacterium]
MIHIKQKWGSTLLVLLIIVYVAISFVQNYGSSNEITKIYFADRFTFAHKLLIEKYNKLNEGKVKVIPIDFPNFDFSTNERKEVLARSLRGTGDGIDLLAVDLIWVQRFAKWCEPLGQYFSEDEKKRILPCALESCYSNGKLVAVPLNLVQGVLYYREDIIKKLKNGEEIIKKIKNSVTWEDFIKLNKKLNLNNPFYLFPAADYEGLICCYMELILSMKPNYFKEYGFNLKSPAAKKSLQLLVDLVNKYKISPPEVTEFTEVTCYEYFIKNNGLFMFGWPTFDKDFKETPFDILKESNLKKAPPQYFEKGVPTSVFGGWDLMISKYSNKKKEVADFVKFLLSDESQEVFYKESSYYPVVNKFYESDYYTSMYPEISEIKKMLKIGVHRPADEEYTKYSKIMSYYFDLAIKNKISVDEALQKSTDAIQIEKKMFEEF